MMKKYKKTVGVIALCVIAAAILFFIISVRSREANTDRLGDSIINVIEGEEGKVTTVSRASLEKVLEISELSTADYTYNAIAKAYAEDGTTVKYYVSYEGKIKAGIDFNEVHFDINEDEKIITVTLPDVELQEKTVNPGTLEYIFIDKKSETETVHQEAFQLCERDLEERAEKEEELFTLARENAAAVVEALVMPWVKQLYGEYTIETR